MQNKLDDRWMLRLRAADRPGVIARVSLVFQHLAVNIDYVRFDVGPEDQSLGVMMFRSSAPAGNTIVRRVRRLIDVLEAELVWLGHDRQVRSERTAVLQFDTP